MCPLPPASNEHDQENGREEDLSADSDPDARPVPDASRGLDGFLAAYWADRDAGKVRSLAAYLEQFPVDEMAVAEEYLALEKESPPASIMDEAADASDAAWDAGKPKPEDEEPGSGLPIRLGDPRVGPYRLIRELGRGGQGEVYLAEDTRLRRKVALKLLTNLGPVSGSLLGRFRREAEVASRLDHPGICTVYEAGQVRNTPFIAMRFVEGESLATRILRTREEEWDQPAAIMPSPPPADSPATTPTAARTAVFAVVRLFEQTARALHAAHQAGVIHRDIKPGNIMVTPRSDPVILDFGLARDLAGDQPTLTITGDLFGTPAYMAPEQLTGSRTGLDARTDVFSLGVSLFECLTLSRPFDGPTREALFQNILTREPPDPHRLNPAVPPDLAIVVHTALQKDRDHRYNTALDMAEDLRRVFAREPIRAKPVSRLVRFSRWVQRNPALASAVFGLFGVLAVGLAVSLVLLFHMNRALDEVRVQKQKAVDALDRLADEYERSLGLQLAHEALNRSEENPGLALLLAIAAAERTPGNQTDRALRESLVHLREKTTLLGSPAHVTRATFSPDGRRVLTLNDGGQSRLWDAETGAESRVLPGEQRFSPAGGGSVDTRVEPPTAPRIIARQDGSAAIQHPDGRQTPLDPNLASAIQTIIPDAGGSRLAVVTRDHALLLLDPIQGTITARVLAPGAAAEAVRFAPDGGQLAIIRGGSGQIFDTVTGRLTCTLASRESLRDLAWSPDGRRLATPASGHAVVVWSIPSGQALCRLTEHRAEVTHAAFSPDGQRLATASADFTARIWDVNTGLTVAVLRGHGNRINTVAFDTSGDRVVTASDDRTARIWDVTPRAGSPVIPTTAELAPRAHLRPDASQLAIPSATIRRRVDMIDPANGTVDHTLVEPDAIPRLVRYSPHGDSLVVVAENRQLHLYDAETGRLQGALQIRTVEALPFSVVVSPDSQRVVALTNQGAVLWAAGRDAGEVVLKGHDAVITFAAFSPDGRLLATASDDRTARIWDAATGQPVAVCRGHQGLVWPVRFDASGQRVLTASSDGTVRLWSSRTGESIAVLTVADEGVINAFFDHDSKRILTLGAGRRAAIWDAATGRCLHTLEHGDDLDEPGSFSPDGTRAVTVTRNMLHLWDVATGQRLAVLRHPEPAYPVIQIRFSPDGHRLVTFAVDGTLRSWSVDPLAEARRRAPRALTDEEKARFKIR